MISGETDLPERRARTRPRDHRAEPSFRRQRRRVAADRQQAGGAEILRQPHRDARPAGDQRMPGAGRADGEQMLVIHRIHDGIAPAGIGQARDLAPDRGLALVHHGEGDEAYAAIGLARQHAYQIGVRHRRQRVVLHPRFTQQLLPDEQMPLVDAAPIRREGGAGDGEARTQPLQQRIRDGADIARIRAVEGGAVFEEDLPRAGGDQRIRRREAFRHRLRHRRRARLQRDDDRIRLRQWSGRDADHLHRRHAVLHQHGSEVGRAGEIIRDAAEQQGHQPGSFPGGRQRMSA